MNGCHWQAWADPLLNRIRTDPRMVAILEPLIGYDLKQIINKMHSRPEPHYATDKATLQQRD